MFNLYGLMLAIINFFFFLNIAFNIWTLVIVTEKMTYFILEHNSVLD